MCKAEHLLCNFCKEELPFNTIAWHLHSLKCFACDRCFKKKKEAGVLWGIGQATPVKIVKELPQELAEENEESEWHTPL